MACRPVLLALLAVAPAAAVTRGGLRGGSILGESMQPEVVARTLKGVEEEWKAQAALFAQCNSTSEGGAIVDCQDAPKSFGKSCGIVVGAVVQGSNGDKKVAAEYMTNVCGQSAIQGWHQQQCKALALAINGAMTADTYQNRYNLNSMKLCSSFWSRFLKAEEARLAEEAAAREAAEKKAAEEEEAARKEAEKKAAEEAERKAKEEAARVKAEAERKQIEEAARAKAEAEAKAKEAAERLAQKKAEAAAVAEAAQKKLAEAAEAEREHKQALANLTVNASQPAEATVEAAKPVEAAKAPEAPAAPKPAAADVKPVAAKEPVAVKAPVAAKAPVTEPVAAAKPVVAVVAPAAAKKDTAAPAKVAPAAAAPAKDVKSAAPVKAKSA